MRKVYVFLALGLTVVAVAMAAPLPSLLEIVQPQEGDIVEPDSFVIASYTGPPALDYATLELRALPEGVLEAFCHLGFQRAQAGALHSFDCDSTTGVHSLHLIEPQVGDPIGSEDGSLKFAMTGLAHEGWHELRLEVGGQQGSPTKPMVQVKARYILMAWTSKP